MKIRILTVLSMCAAAFLSTGYASTDSLLPFTDTIQQEKGSKLDPTPHIIPRTHRFKKVLDKIFSQKQILDNAKAFESAGFETRVFRQWNGLRVASHPKLKGYLFKVFLEKDAPGKAEKRQQNLIRRCVVASKVRRLITKHKMQHFTVPQKWLYPVPNKKGSTFVLIVKDMNLVTREKSKQAWKKQITKSHLRELNILLGHGYGSLAIDQNIPYTKAGTFSFIDTEYLKRDLDLHRVNRNLSYKMQKYWKQLTHE